METLPTNEKGGEKGSWKEWRNTTGKGEKPAPIVKEMGSLKIFFDKILKNGQFPHIIGQVQIGGEIGGGEINSSHFSTFGSFNPN
jgi:hypothetical protein